MDQVCWQSIKINRNKQKKISIKMVSSFLFDKVYKSTHQMLSIANICRQPGAGTHLASCGIFLRALTHRTEITSQLDITNHTSNVQNKTTERSSSDSILSTCSFFPHGISACFFSSFLLINICFKHTVSIRVHFFISPLAETEACGEVERSGDY